MAIRRRQFVVNREIQFGYAGIVIWLMMNGALVIGALTYFTTLNTILTEIERAGAGPFNVYDIVSKVNGVLLYRLGILFLGLVAMAGFFEIFFLHRIVGPIFAIERRLDATEKGRPFEPIILRKKDYFQTLAAVINRMLVRQRARDEAVAELLAAAAKSPDLAVLVERVKAL